MATVSIVSTQVEPTSYIGELTITNGSSTYSSWNLLCLLQTGTTIQSLSKFTLSTGIEGQLIISPRKDFIPLLPTQIISERIVGGGKLPTDFIFSGTLVGPSGPSSSGPSSGPSGPSSSGPSSGPSGPSTGPFPTYLYNLPLTNLPSISSLTGFNYQYSYNQQNNYNSTNPNPNYFSVSPTGLIMSIYPTDLSFQHGNSTEPRTELRGLVPILDNVEYILSFDQFIQTYPETEYDFCWCQVFGGNGPNVMLRYRSGHYELLCISGNLPNLKLSGDIKSDIGVWTNWKLNFFLSPTNGYVKVYRNNNLVGQSFGNTSGGNNSYLKHGIYSQEMIPPSVMTTITKNLELYF